MNPFRNGAAGVVSSAKLFRPEDFAELTTPSEDLSEASRLLVDAAATPYSLQGESFRHMNVSSRGLVANVGKPSVVCETFPSSCGNPHQEKAADGHRFLRGFP